MSGIGGIRAQALTGPIPNRVISRLATQAVTTAAERLYNWYTAPPARMGYDRYAASPARTYGVRKKARAPKASRGFYGPRARMKRCMKEIQEKKFVDVAARTDAFDTTGVVVPINLCATGTDYTERIGRKSTVVSLQIRGFIEAAGTQATDGLCRILCVYDTQVNGALPNVNDILDTTSALSFMNLNNRDRFKVIFDWVRPMGKQDTLTANYIGGHEVSHIKKYKKVNLPAVWDGTTAAIGSCQSGAIYMVFIGTVAANKYECTWQSRVRFVDN